MAPTGSNTSNGDDSARPLLSYAPVVGRRRTRALAQLESHERRERFKRHREQQQQDALQDDNENRENHDINTTRTAVTESSALSTATALQSPRPKVVVGASFGDKVPADVAVERTPTKKELQSPPQIRRVKQAPPVIVPTPEKAVPASVGIEEDEGAADGQSTGTASGENTMATLAPKRVPSRGIAQSGSFSSNRKRMISFSPERSEPPENRALALMKLQKNLKANEKLQQRLEGVGVMLRNEEPRSAFTTPSKDMASRPASRMRQSPAPITTTPATRTPVKRTPVKSNTPSAAQTLGFGSDDDDEEAKPSSGAQQQLNFGNPLTPVKPITCPAATTSAMVSHDEAEKEDGVDIEEQDLPSQELQSTQDICELESQLSQPMLSQQDGGDTQLLSSQQSEVCMAPPLSCSQETQIVDFSSSSSVVFTSTSVIEDVGLFNCESDVEYTGGVYGEGTDGKVSAAVIGGQKVALKRAKPHEGFPEEEAKRRSAVELHYLRKVRHMPGFVQCLGLCDGIEHTCIALEVMDCKLSDYLRRYGKNEGKSSSKRRFTLSLEETKGMLKQIALPMMLLHDQVNVAHGDLACRNILLRTPPKGYEQKWEPVVKLSDFGRIKVPSTEPKILDEGFSFYKNCDVGSFGREILFRFLVGEIVPPACLETRSLHKSLQDLVVKQIPEDAKLRLGPYYRLFMRCTGWGVRPTFREIYEHLDDLEYFETTENGLFPLKPSGGPSAADASFMSPVMDGNRSKFASSGSKGGKFETPNGSMQRTSAGAARLLQSKSGTEGSIPNGGNKTVNWLKARSVLTNAPHQVANPSNSNGTANNSNPSANTSKLHPRNLATSSAFTPNGRPMLLKKTPPSAGASRRSLQILNQIQHRTNEKAKK
uniref:Protein kinase domain-containing protein n=1 Tax=Globisporangium ultimum (strain ATCC 200006 / CBS 805.95 / DAOM BR144) TaxID=431595 RepID=K3X2K6_GLOUD